MTYGIVEAISKWHKLGSLCKKRDRDHADADEIHLHKRNRDRSNSKTNHDMSLNVKVSMDKPMTTTTIPTSLTIPFQFCIRCLRFNPIIVDGPVTISLL